jgi:hypothetical protein
MGWTTIKYACGHTDQQQMYGKVSERDRRAEYMGRSKCPTCAAAEAVEKSSAAGLPVLTGSDKQIAWAAQIRERALRLLPADRAEKLRPETSAKWWIDHRDTLSR